MITIILVIAIFALVGSLGVTTLPTYSKTIDDTFTQTWYEIRPEAADNILNATVITAWLRQKGCFKPQEGGNTIERSLEYALPPTKAVGKGDVLGSGETNTRSAYFWDFDRNLSVHIQRSLFGKNGDRANRGKFQIINYVMQRLERATEAMKQQQETDLFNATSTDETGVIAAGSTAPSPRSLYDLVPSVASRATGTWGGINRPTAFDNTSSAGLTDTATTGNIWNTPKYMCMDSDPEVNLLSNIKHFYNVVTDQIETPDGIITSQNLFEIYLEYGLDQTQIVGSSELLKLGFSTAKYLDADLVWSKLQTVDNMRFLNSRWLECIFDPMVWFMMTEWNEIPGQLERIAYILCTQSGPISNQLRRHGLLYSGTTQ